ncbi:NAD-dependent epimerase/dehydratase family protein [Candidatus Uhrbacteria bacterium]|nr:NAD-dependent epimerase/dehydratase family protein [Candidatus Uhrbacteria bacterium]
MPKKVLVTGGAGFIGSHLVDALVAHHYQVTVVDDLSLGVREQVNAKASFVRLDIRKPRIEEVVREVKPTVVFHLAAQIDPRVSVVDPSFDADVNVVGSLRLLEAARRVGVEKFIFASSGGAIYGGTEKLPTPETCLAHPFSPYGVSKLAFEEYLHCYYHVYGLPYVALRFSNVYGPRQSPKGEAGVVALFTRKMLHGEQPIINGDGKQTRDFVYVDDVVNANLLALPAEANGVYNIGTGLETSVNEIFRTLKKMIGVTTREAHGSAKIGEERRSVLANRKARRELGWRPTVALEEGLRRTVEWFRPRVE